eukprot:TRINITY_DN8631_c0_g1_i1.p1 TRINITY_DN8631_c0_g1~~TRINITY_DN8631_c0_g1_i1.p1  ORF type:complete len:231 (-),score=49.49 TRINITY_DN8631_c0_g1_i1:85-777(-)
MSTTHQVDKQLDLMVKFILNEANSKAEEINTKTEDDVMREKNELIKLQKQKIGDEYKRKEKAVEISKKIAHSNELAKSRVMILKAREVGVQKILDTARSRLEELSKKDIYGKLLVDLIVQGFTRLDEPDVEIRSREEDNALVLRAIPSAVAQYEKTTGKKVNATLDTKHPLPPSPSLAGPKALHTCSGGVVLQTKGGRIVCNNTLDVRLQYAFEAAVPAIRAKLFTVDVF